MYKFRLEDEHLLWWEQGRDRNTGCLKKVSIACVVRLRTGVSTHVHVYTAKSSGTKPVFKTACTEEDAQSVLSWFYGKAFPPSEILEITNPEAYKAALRAFDAEAAEDDES